MAQVDLSPNIVEQKDKISPRWSPIENKPNMIKSVLPESLKTQINDNPKLKEKSQNIGKFLEDEESAVKIGGIKKEVQRVKQEVMTKIRKSLLENRPDLVEQSVKLVDSPHQINKSVEMRPIQLGSIKNSPEKGEDLKGRGLEQSLTYRPSILSRDVLLRHGLNHWRRSMTPLMPFNEVLEMGRLNDIERQRQIRKSL